MYTIFSAYLVGPGECHKLCDLTASQCARHVIETTTIKEEDVTFYSSYFVVTTLTVVTTIKVQVLSNNELDTWGRLFPVMATL